MLIHTGDTIKVLYNAFVVTSLNLLHHKHFYRLLDVREALRAIYLKSDSSRFQYLLGFRNVAAGIVIEDDIRPDVNEVLRDIEVDEQKRPFDTKDDVMILYLQPQGKGRNCLAIYYILLAVKKSHS